MKKTAFLFLISTLALFCKANSGVNIIPKPYFVQELKGNFLFTEKTIIEAPEEFEAEAQYLASMFEVCSGFNLDVKRKYRKAQILFKQEKDLQNQLGDEGYLLNVLENKITIRAAKAAGAFYAVQRIKQMLPVEVAGYYPYFDYVQSSQRKEEPYVAFNNVLPLKKVYQYNPVPDELSEDESKYILGAQANMWSNYINSSAHFEYMTYPRLCALAELTWTSPEKKDYQVFESKLEKHYKRFDEMHVAYRRHDKGLD